MRKLFIIGNGFDSAHNLPTKYSHFQNYLMKRYPKVSDECFVVPQSSVMPDGEERYDDNEVVGFLLKVISKSKAKGETWEDFENILGHLDFGEYFDVLNVHDDDDDDNEWHKVYTNEDIAVNICDAVQMIKKYFSDWIDTIKIFRTKPKISFSNLIDPDRDLFLTFNYTETLEYLYRVKNVFHIHGKQGGKLIIGHGNTTDYFESYINRYIGAENYLGELQVALKKDTKGIINQYKKLFIEFGKVDEIYSYGFSFSDVDMVYIKELCNVSKTENMVWYFNDYDKKKFDTFKYKLVQCGFKGKFDMFKI